MLLDANQLRRVDAEGTVDGCALVLHGGTDNRAKAVRPSRRWPSPGTNAERIANGLAKRTRGHGVGVWTLRHRLAGWDRDDKPTPVLEARAAVEAIHEAHPRKPIVLIGHSMGGRTAVSVADGPGVVGVIGLAPWLPESQSAEPMTGKHLRIAHSRLDHECRLASMRDFLTRAELSAASVEIEDMGWDVHYMVREKRWHDYTANQALSVLVGGH